MLVETGAGRLFVHERGEGPPVVLWHSLLCDTGMWKHQIPALADRYRVVSIDGPGHGRSAVADHAYSMDDCVDAAVAVLDAAGIDRCAWVGLSWGGMVGMRLAARHPKRVAALVLMDTSARAESSVKKAAYRPLAALARRFGPVRPLSRVITPIMFGPDPSPDAVETFVQTVTRMDPQSIQHALDAVTFHRDDVTDELSRIDAPTLVLVGAEDRATPPSEAEHLASHIRGARLVRIPQAGHLSTLEAPDRVNGALSSFLDDNVA